MLFQTGDGKSMSCVTLCVWVCQLVSVFSAFQTNLSENKQREKGDNKRKVWFKTVQLVINDLFPKTPFYSSFSNRNHNAFKTRVPDSSIHMYNIVRLHRGPSRRLCAGCPESKQSYSHHRIASQSQQHIISGENKACRFGSVSSKCDFPHFQSLVVLVGERWEVV